MAFTVEGNFALKDKLIRSEFRLVDVEIRVGDFRSPNRVSSLLQRELAGRESTLELINNQSLPPGIRALEGFGGGPLGTPGGPMEGPPAEPGAAMEITGKQVYTVRGDSSTGTVFRGARLLSDGFLVRVSGELTSSAEILSTDEGITFLVSDSDELNSIGRLGGDHDLINMGTGDPVVGDHAIGLIDRATNVGFVVPAKFDVGFHTPVRAGQRLCVEQDVAVGAHFYAVFEVAQFANVQSSTGYVGMQIRQSVPVDPPAPVFQPVVMQESIFRPKGRIVNSLAEVNQLLMLGWIIVGNVFPDGIFST